MMDSPWEVDYVLAHNDACFQISGNKMYTSLNLIVSPSSFCFMQDRISVILASCPCWSSGPHQSFPLIIFVFGMGIFVCLSLFMNCVLERTLKTNFQGRNLANNAVALLVSLDSANFFDNLSPYRNSSFCLGNLSYATSIHPLGIDWGVHSPEKNILAWQFKVDFYCSLS